MIDLNYFYLSSEYKDDEICNLNDLLNLDIKSEERQVIYDSLNNILFDGFFIDGKFQTGFQYIYNKRYYIADNYYVRHYISNVNYYENSFLKKQYEAPPNLSHKINNKESLNGFQNIYLENRDLLFSGELINSYIMNGRLYSYHKPNVKSKVYVYESGIKTFVHNYDVTEE